MKRSHCVLSRLLILSTLFSAVFCGGQSAPNAGVTDANQSARPVASSGGQTSVPTTAPANPSAQPAGQSQSQSKDTQAAKDNSTDPATASAGTSSTGTAAGTSASGTSKDRLFFALPNFLTLENSGNLPPLTTAQKYKVVAQGSFDPIQIVWYGALSSLSQAENSEPGFGQGWAAYGKRFGAYAADGTIENFFVGAILPSMLRQDPRFFQLGHGSFFARSGYAVSRIFVTRTDSGHKQFNYSEIVGAAMASAISTYAYHPHPGYTPGQTTPFIASDRTLKNTASVWGSQVGYDTITLVVKEFWPDIRRKLLKKQPH